MRARKIVSCIIKNRVELWLTNGLSSAIAIGLEEIGKVEHYSLHHPLVKRAPPDAVVYNLTFGYDFHVLNGRADANDVLIRVDYSNDEGYWEKVVGRF